MTTIYTGRRWEISLGQYVTMKATARYLGDRRAEIDLQSGEAVDPLLVDADGRYEPIEKPE